MSTQYSEPVAHALSALVVSQPFFASYLFDVMKIVEDPSCATAATDGKTIWVGPWFSKLSMPERIFVLCHEILHAIMLHCGRAKGWKDMGVGPDLKPFSFKRWNIAADHIINDALISDSIGKAPPGLLHNTSIATADDLVDNIYKIIPDEQDEQEQGEGQGQGQGQGQGKGQGQGQGQAGGFDEHVMPESATTEADVLNNERAIKSAESAAKSQGKMPGNLRKLVENLLNPTVPWQDLLRMNLFSASRIGDNDWSRPNRRKLAFSAVTGIDLPIYASHQSPRCGDVVVQVDTSGSISVEEVSKFLSEIKGIVEDVAPESLRILWTDSRVAHVDLLEHDIASGLDEVIARVLRDGAPGGGGTRMQAGFEYVEEWAITPTAFVTFSDGYTGWPESFSGFHLALITVESKLDGPKHLGPTYHLKTS